MKRHRLRPTSKKRARLMRRVAPDRAAFLAEHKTCWFCLAAPATEVHEIACGSHREKALDDACTWAAACHDCNVHRLTDYAEWPLARQLAVKFLEDVENYARRRFNALRGRAPDAIDDAEVKAWIKKEARRR